jgi:hypothetical protein
MPHLPIIKVEAEKSLGSTSVGNRTGTFFSGGVDSLYTLLHHEDAPNAARAERIDDLITIFGIFSRERQLVEQKQGTPMRMHMDAIAQRFNKRRIEVHTNLYRTRFSRTNSLLHSHGCVLAAAALAMGKRYSRILIPSSTSYNALTHLGSHPLTDRLFSTTATRFISDGCRFSRYEKTAYLTTRDHDLSSLQVCSRDPELRNCAKCAKCVRTMLILGSLGKLDGCELFREPVLDLTKVASIYCSTLELKYDLECAQKDARKRGLWDIEQAVETALLRSAWICNCRTLIGRLRRGERPASHEIKLLTKLSGASESVACSKETRTLLDRALREMPALRAYLMALSRNDESENAVSTRPVYREYCLLEHALIGASICESTLDLQRRWPGQELCSPAVRFNSIEWIHRLGLIGGEREKEKHEDRPHLFKRSGVYPTGSINGLRWV